MTEEITTCETDADFAQARGLFEAYADALGLDLGFQGFEAELEALPTMYGPPTGVLLLARDGEEAVGCVGVRARSEGACEMKRRYVRPERRGTGLGRRLAEAALAHGRSLGYRLMMLDTLATMGPALALYRALGFREIEAYTHSPLDGVFFFALDLRRVSPPTGLLTSDDGA